MDGILEKLNGIDFTHLFVLVDYITGLLNKMLIFVKSFFEQKIKPALPETEDEEEDLT